jgi:hypothetical protein
MVKGTAGSCPLDWVVDHWLRSDSELTVMRNRAAMLNVSIAMWMRGREG